MADDFNKNMQIIMGKSAQRDVELSADDKKNLSTAYQKLFANLTYNHWLRGGTLGKAWYNTLTQMKQFIQSMGTAGPVAMYLRQMFASHSAEWAKVMMTNPNRETVLDVDEKTKSEWNRRTATDLTGARESILAMVNKYKAAEKSVRASDNNATKSPDMFNAAAQKIRMLMILRMQQKRNNGMAA